MNPYTNASGALSSNEHKNSVVLCASVAFIIRHFLLSRGSIVLPTQRKQQLPVRFFGIDNRTEKCITIFVRYNFIFN